MSRDDVLGAIRGASNCARRDCETITDDDVCSMLDDAMKLVEPGD